jgi:large subunit ribosomal protein L7/L12
MVEIVDVVLADAGIDKKKVIMALREVTGKEPTVKLMDLRQALRCVDNTPCVAVPNVPEDAGGRIKARLEQAGATVELKPA